MSHTDDLISERRRSGASGERREFSVDRAQAIRKMRQFALEDPSYYLLELIQAAIANDAGFLNIDLFRLHRDQDDLKMRWTGRGFNRFALVRLFDFLLMSEDEPGCADTILLARGVNAMLHFEPKRVVIASGDGTLDGSAKVVISGDGEIEEVEVSQAVDGVRIHGERMYLSLLKPQLEQRLGDREVAMLRDKVIAPGVQVMLNGHFISDWSSAHLEQRHWGTDSIDIEEDDLYGRLWLSPFGGNGQFDVMTWGVKVERLEREDAPFETVYGAVNFNRLNKTADHAKIVRDEVLDELWARLRPYAERLKTGRGEVAFDISHLDGTKFRPPDLVELLRTNHRVVVVPASWPVTVDARQVAGDVARALESPVLVVPDGEQETLEMLSGGRVELVEPRLDHERDVEVLTAPVASPPPRPWLVEPLKVEPIPAQEFIRYVCDEHGIEESTRRQIAEVLGVRGSVHMRVYSPGTTGQDHERLETLQVSVLVCEREVFSARYPTAFFGHTLVVELPPASPSRLFETVASGGAENRETTVALAARTCVQLAQHRIEQAHDRAKAALRRVAGVSVEQEEAKERYIAKESVEEHTVRGVVGLPVEPVTEFAIEVLDANSGRVHRLFGPARELRLVGQLVAYDARVVETTEWLESVICRHGERLLERLARRLPRIDDPDERELVAGTLLGFAGQKLAFRQGEDGRVDWTIEGKLARQILQVPLFPGRRQVPTTPMRLIRRLCARRNAGRAEGAVDELLAPDSPDWVRQWVEKYLDLTTLEHPSPQDAGKRPVVAAEQRPARLLTTLELLLERLRPDTEDDALPREFRLSWVRRDEGRSPFADVRLHQDHVEVQLDPEHGLVERARRLATHEATAWLLLAVYAAINARLEPVTNDHELAFQRRVADALEAGTMVS